MININDIRKPLRKPVHVNMYNGNLREYSLYNEEYYGPYNKKIDFNVFLESKGVNLQRPFVWTLKQKQELILSILKGVDIPRFTVLIHENKDKTKILKIIDGKQRLSTMIDFMYDKFPIVIKGKEYVYSDFLSVKDCRQTYGENIKFILDSFAIHFNQVYSYWDDCFSDEELIEWFEQINFSGTPQDEEHLKTLKNK